MDSYFTIIDGSGNRYAVHIECQTNPDGSIVLRFAEYDLQLAIETRTTDEHNIYDLYLPHSALLNLRGVSKPEIIRIHKDDQTLIHRIEVQNMKDLTVDDLLVENAAALLPFYIFTHKEDPQKLADDPVTAAQLVEEFKYICDGLDKMAAGKKINAYELGVLLELMKKVTRNAVSNSEVAEEVSKMANGRILDLYTVKIYEAGELRGEMRGEERGEKRGEERGEKRGEKRGREEGRREMVFNLVKKNKLSETDGAKELQMTLDEFKEALSAFAG